MTGAHKHKLSAVVLAAGGGTRMRSRLPKVLHPVAGKPMMAHVLDAVSALNPQAIVTVVAPDMEAVRRAVSKSHPEAAFCVQEKARGTGDAVASALSALKGEGVALVVYGDTPLITAETLGLLLAEMAKNKAGIALLGMQPADPAGYGRLVLSEEKWVQRIVECKDADADQKRIGWVWGGVMAFDLALLREHLPNLQPSGVTGEYYLTSLIEMAREARTLMVPMTVEEAMGVNDRAQLAEAEAAMQRRLRRRAMLSGVTMIDPATVYLNADTVLGQDTVVHPGVVFGAGVRVGEGVEIRAYSHLEGVTVGAKAVIGPFARLRPGSEIGAQAHVGNFVELKNATLGEGAKVSHLTYLGDAQIGSAANIGAGTITCNYDGFAKHRTRVGDGAFIGSNSSLVAPVSIGAHAIVGAGSVITEDVPDGALAIGRAPQTVKTGKAQEIRQRRMPKTQ